MAMCLYVSFAFTSSTCNFSAILKCSVLARYTHGTIYNKHLPLSNKCPSFSLKTNKRPRALNRGNTISYCKLMYDLFNIHCHTCTCLYTDSFISCK